MRKFTSLQMLSEHLIEVGGLAKGMPRELAEDVAPVLAKEIKGVMGTSQLRDLEKSTQLDRASRGYPPNEPLVVTGELRASVEHAVSHNTAKAGSSDPRSKWHNDGFFNVAANKFVEPRPFFLLGMLHTERYVNTLIREVIELLMT